MNKELSDTIQLIRAKIERLPNLGMPSPEEIHQKFQSLWEDLVAELAHFMRPVESSFEVFLDVIRQVAKKDSTRYMAIYLMVNLLVMMLEYRVGHTHDSVGLISDAAHMLNDNIALTIGTIAAAITNWDVNERYSFGFARFETLSAFVQSLLLMSFAVIGVIKAIARILTPVPMEREGLMTTTVIGLIMNAIGFLLLGYLDQEHQLHSHGHSHKGESPTSNRRRQFHHKDESTTSSNTERNPNTHGMYLHLFSDLLGSIGLVFSTFLAEYNFMRADPLISLFICFVIFFEASDLMRSTSSMLLLRTPKHLQKEFGKMKKQISKSPGVVSVENIHVWQCSSGKIVSSLCIGIEHEHFTHDNVERLLVKTREDLKSLGIDDITIQIAPSQCCV